MRKRRPSFKFFQKLPINKWVPEKYGHIDERNIKFRDVEHRNRFSAHRIGVGIRLDSAG